MATKLQFRRDTATNWTTNNPVLAEGEIGLDLTNNLFKIGDGTSTWSTIDPWSEGSIFEQKEITTVNNTLTYAVPGGYSGTVEVLLNGFTLASSDYTANDGTNVVFTANPGDGLLVVKVYRHVAIADVLPISGGSLTGSLTLPNVDLTTTEGLIIPDGTTAERPVAPTNGLIRYNTDDSVLETYVNDGWISLTSVGFDWSALLAQIQTDLNLAYTDGASFYNKVATESQEYREAFNLWVSINYALINASNVNIYNNILRSSTATSQMMEYEEGFTTLLDLYTKDTAAKALLQTFVDTGLFSNITDTPDEVIDITYEDTSSSTFTAPFPNYGFDSEISVIAPDTDLNIYYLNTVRIEARTFDDGGKYLHVKITDNISGNLIVYDNDTVEVISTSTVVMEYVNQRNANDFTHRIQYNHKPLVTNLTTEATYDASLGNFTDGWLGTLLVRFHRTAIPAKYVSPLSSSDNRPTYITTNLEAVEYDLGLISTSTDSFLNRVINNNPQLPEGGSSVDYINYLGTLLSTQSFVDSLVPNNDIADNIFGTSAAFNYIFDSSNSIMVDWLVSYGLSAQVLTYVETAINDNIIDWTTIAYAGTDVGTDTYTNTALGFYWITEQSLTNTSSTSYMYSNTVDLYDKDGLNISSSLALQVNQGTTDPNNTYILTTATGIYPCSKKIDITHYESSATVALSSTATVKFFSY